MSGYINWTIDQLEDALDDDTLSAEDREHIERILKACERFKETTPIHIPREEEDE